MKLCITRSQRFVYSETFIRNQISGLQQRTPVWTLHSGRLPEKEEDGSWLSPLPVRLAGKLLRVLTGHRNNYFTFSSGAPSATSFCFITVDTATMAGAHSNNWR